MLPSLSTAIFASHDKKQSTGLFLSAFDGAGNLLASNGVMSTNKTLEEVLTTLYNGIIKPLNAVSMIVADVVTSSYEQTDMQQLLTLDIKTHGLFVSTIPAGGSGVILPNTAGIADVRHALFVLKQKYHRDGGVAVTVFTSHRIAVQG